MEQATTPLERRRTRSYALQMLAVLAVYAPLLIGTIILVEDHSDAWWRFPVALLPVLPFIVGTWVVLRFIRQEDELQQRISLMSLSIAFAGTAIVTFGYGFLQIAGAPDANWTLVWPIMGMFWIIGGFVARWRYR
jgi:hypothetical protein